MAGPIVAVAILFLIGGAFKFIFRLQSHYANLQLWEYITIIITGPVVMVVTWLPFDLEVFDDV